MRRFKAGQEVKVLVGSFKDHRKKRWMNGTVIGPAQRPVPLSGMESNYDYIIYEREYDKRIPVIVDYSF